MNLMKFKNTWNCTAIFLSPDSKGSDWRSFEEKLNNWQSYMKGKDWLLQSSGAPPLFKYLWAHEVKVKPPHFLNPLRLGLASGIYFGLGMMLIWSSLSVVDYFIFGTEHKLTVFNFLLGIVASATSGSFFGIITSIAYFLESRIRKLPRWDHL